MDRLNPALRDQQEPCCWMPSYLQSIVDLKVRRVALTTFQAIVDWVCSWLWCGYADYSDSRLRQAQIAEGDNNRIRFRFDDQEEAIRVAGMRHDLQGKPLFDQTNERVAGIKKDGDSKPYITLDGRRVILDIGCEYTDFTGLAHPGAYFVVADDENASGCYVIREMMADDEGGQINSWHVDTRKSYNVWDCTDGFQRFFQEGAVADQEDFERVEGSSVPVFVADESLPPELLSIDSDI